MAALRGPSSTRKSSRFSSPVTVPRVERETASTSNDVERVKEIPKTFLDHWVEPPLRTPAPSFEDHRGLERVGVLEHFQPLGQPPTQKFLQKLKLAPPRPGRATPVQNEEVSTPTNGVEDTSTASPAEEFQRPPSADESIMRVTPIPSPIRVGKEIDEDYQPAVLPVPVPTRPKMTVSHSASIPPTPLPSGGYIYHGHYHPETIKQHVDAAVRRAEMQSPELAPGLRKLCADSELDPALWAVLDAILNRSPTREQYKIFHRYVRAGKKEYSRHSTPTARANSLARAASNQHLTPTQHITTTTTYSAPVQPPVVAPPYPQSSVQPLPIFHPQPTLPIQTPQFQSPPKLPPSSNHQQQMISSTVTEPAPARPPTPMSTENDAEKALAMTNGDMTPSKAFQEGLQNLETTSQRRSQSVSSSSSLSSAKSLDAETFAPAINEEAQINGTRAAAKSGSDQRQAAAHKPGGNKSRAPKIGLFSVFPNTNKTNARKQSAAEIDELELLRRRQRLQQNQDFHEEYNSRFHTGSSSERAVLAPVTARPIQNHSISIPAPVIHPHHITTFQAALSSPVDALPSAGDLKLRNGISKKRSRDDTDNDEEEIQTPRSSPGPLLVPPPPGAATISRSGTPRGTRMPPAKKVKKSARVMVS
jgi:hypothetical protein